jgi:hypothetical protein
MKPTGKLILACSHTPKIDDVDSDYMKKRIKGITIRCMQSKKGVKERIRQQVFAKFNARKGGDAS